MAIIGIRYEDKYKMEKRVSIVPQHVKELIENQGLAFEVETSEKRVFTDNEYSEAGASVVDSIKEASIIFGVKEMPISFFEKNKTYLFFSQTIKGQEYNMPILKQMMAKEVNLIEYEKITDDNGKRLIFFGKYAGLAGMINSFWSFGQRCMQMGIPTSFTSIKQSHLYTSLDEAKEALSLVAKQIRIEGIPEVLAPLTIGITGYGNVSRGVQEIIDLFHHVTLSPKELLQLRQKGEFDNRTLYKTIFKEEHISKPIDPKQPFELKHYYDYPEEFVNDFEQYVPELTMLMNCMYWSPEYPRIITKAFLKELNRSANNKLCVIGDVTCDPDGSIEATHVGTYIEDPVFVYNPENEEYKMGFDGDGILIMAVDILPSELPREASQAFSTALYNFIPALSVTDFNVPFDELKLPAPLKRALILHQGKLTPKYEYMQEFID